MGKQEAEFFRSEADAWHKRNHKKPRHSVVLDAVEACGFVPRKVLEVGCGDGFNLAEIQHKFGRGTWCYGIEPSIEARTSGKEKYPDLTFYVGGASELNVKSQYDLLIYGFCLYVCDREDLLLIAGAGDRALCDKGYLIVHDFDPEYPHKVPYHHVPGMFTYKMDYSKLWLANPAYSLVHKEIIPDGTAVWVLKKDIEGGWPNGKA